MSFYELEELYNLIKLQKAFNFQLISAFGCLLVICLALYLEFFSDYCVGSTDFNLEVVNLIILVWQCSALVRFCAKKHLLINPDFHL